MTPSDHGGKVRAQYRRLPRRQAEGKERTRNEVLVLEPMSCTRMEKRARPVGGTKGRSKGHEG